MNDRKRNIAKAKLYKYYYVLSDFTPIDHDSKDEGIQLFTCSKGPDTKRLPKFTQGGTKVTLDEYTDDCHYTIGLI